VDVQSEEDFIGMKADEVYIPSAFSINRAEPEVSLVFSQFLWFLIVCMYFFLFFLRRRELRPQVRDRVFFNIRESYQPLGE
jgi:hypothetical protein